MSLPDFLQDDFSRYAFTADEWLTAYAHLSSDFVVVYPAIFSMAMVLELYLKAYCAYLKGNGIDVTKYSHRISDLYEHIQKEDNKFPQEINIQPQHSKYPLHELDKENWQCGWYLLLSDEQKKDIRENYEIYVAMGYAADLKYGVSPSLPKYGGRIISSSWSCLNPWLAKFVVSIRSRIGHPAKNIDDRLFYALRHQGLNKEARAYIQGIYEATTELINN